MLWPIPPYAPCLKTFTFRRALPICRRRIWPGRSRKLWTRFLVDRLNHPRCDKRKGAKSFRLGATYGVCQLAFGDRPLTTSLQTSRFAFNHYSHATRDCFWCKRASLETTPSLPRAIGLAKGHARRRSQSRSGRPCSFRGGNRRTHHGRHWDRPQRHRDRHGARGRARRWSRQCLGSFGEPAKRRPQFGIYGPRKPSAL
ncbi:hypothetical protein EDE08_11783 [Bradyrhizobium sp. R2.2-H]|nr:hypothetical protein EDE10_11763 [Bradyrhizobium sp. Y-H1]TCU65900.1 hypothetical protein EDE08_11783 [Bradyrhizobium sp. R2.2-H]